jgi:FkbM family methyltransferase
MANWRQLLSHIDRLPEMLRCFQIDQHPWRSTSGYLQLSTLQFPLTLTLRSGLRIELTEYHDLVTAWVIFFRCEYKYSESVRTVLDLGTNIGCFTLCVAERLPEARIISVEPFPDTRAKLLGNLDRNPSLKPRITVWDTGIARQAGTRMMQMGTEASASIGILPESTETIANTVTIQTRSFDQLIDAACSTWGVEQIDFLKMDVEGAEYEAMAAASPQAMKRVRALGMEYHPNGSKAALFEDLARGGLKLVHDRDLGGNGIAHFSRN